MAEPTQTFVVAREKWARADAGKGPSRLLNEEGNQCCLGFVCEQLGAHRSTLRQAWSPNGIRYSTDAVKPLLSWADNDPIVFEAMSANDDSTIDDGERERLIASALSRLGYAIEFVDTAEQLEARLAQLKAGTP